MGLTGGCQCGAIRYSANVETGTKAICHCNPCQKVRTTSAFSSNLIIPRNAFKVTKGDPRTYPHLGDSGKLYHHNFCGNCGTEVFGVPEAAPKVLSIKVGSLDSQYRNIGPMHAELFVGNRVNYVQPLEGLKQYDGMLPL
ncbi:putative 60S ribosomal protein L28e [Fusarium oxysporum f. sp. albedinis]|nr:putative 60S ribosomal protein L28e [Fusarium oxysporum f. sp. albedinis]